MEFLYLSPEFPPNFVNFIIQLDRHRANVWALGEADFYTLPESLRRAIRYYVQTDLNSATAVEPALQELLRAKTAAGTAPKFDVVESHNEIWLGLEAHINNILNIPGIQPEDLAPLKRKSAMKRRFEASGLAVAPGAKLQDVPQGLALAKEFGYPLILKPDEGVGAGGIHKVSDQGQLEALLPKLVSDYFMEAFIDAPITTYDGLVDRDGHVLFESRLTYGDGVLDYIQGKDTFFYVERRIPDALGKIGRQLVESFDIRRKFFHFEFFCTEGSYLPIEINCRPPGGAILDMMNYSVDDDLYAAYARMITSQVEAMITKDKKYFCAYAGRRDRDYVYSHDQLVRRLGGALVEFGENPAIFQQAMSRYRYIVRSPDRERLLDMVREIQLMQP